MSRSRSRRITHGVRVLAIAALVFGATESASAQITFAGSTAYRFNGGAWASPQTLGGMTITQTGFSVVTNPSGYAAVGGSGSSFGSVDLQNTGFTYAGNTIDLLIGFTSPTAANQMFFAVLAGEVVGNSGGANIHFNPTTISNIPFTNGPGSGVFSIDINNVSITYGQPDVLITGDIVADTNQGGLSTPEPASLSLVATGLVGLAAFARTRRKAKAKA